MNLYKAYIKKNNPKENAHSWGDEYYLIKASSFGNAEDKMKKFITTGEMCDLTYIGVVTKDEDVILLKERM